MDNNLDNILKSLSSQYNSEDKLEEKENLEIKNSPVVRCLDHIIEKAYYMNASDIHFEPLRDISRIRFRIDGDLVKILEIEKSYLNLLVTRLKVMAKIELSNKKVPQEGRIDILVDKKVLDLRVSIIPGINGEKAVIRILNKEFIELDKKNIGLNDFDLEKISNIINKKMGLILVTGPTGSGKTTTAYSLIKDLNRADMNIVTIEDPVEYKIPGTTQIQVDNNSNFGFKNALKFILRQDPDFIFVGEIRDKATARIAIEAANTGHLVIATMHTKGTLSTIIRLIDFEIEKYLIASTLNLIISQSLVKKLCNNCRKKYKADSKEKEILDINNSKDLYLYRAENCKKCRYGYDNRQAVFEVMEVDHSIRKWILGDLNKIEILNIIKKYPNSIEEQIKLMVLKGRTSLDQYIQIKDMSGRV